MFENEVQLRSLWLLSCILYNGCMLYVLGLGNPEQRYTDTPHNIGWRIVDRCVNLRSLDDLEKKSTSWCVKDSIADEPVWWIKPTTYMNRSGEALRDFAIDSAEEVVVIYDDIDLPYGAVRLSRNRGDGGHNGVKSIEQELRSRDFIRIRIGVCPRDWFGNPRKPKGSQAISCYLTERALSRRYLYQEGEVAHKVVAIIESLQSKGYQTTISQQ